MAKHVPPPDGASDDAPAKASVAANAPRRPEEPGSGASPPQTTTPAPVTQPPPPHAPPLAQPAPASSSPSPTSPGDVQTVTCEWCGYQQPIGDSIFCDRCGRRMLRARVALDAVSGAGGIVRPAAVEPHGPVEFVRCPNCGDYNPDTSDICNNCGAQNRNRTL